MDVDHGYFYCCWGGHFKKRTMRIEIYLAISFFLLVLFIYFSFFLSFLFLLSSFPSFVFFFQPLGGGGAIAPSPPPSDSPLDLPRNFILSTCFDFFYLLFLFSLFSFSPFLFSLFCIFFVSLWGGGGSPHRPPPSDPPLDLPRNFILSTCFVYLLFLFSLFSFSPFLFSLFSIFFVSLWGGDRPIAPPQIRHWIYLAISFFLLVLFIYFFFFLSFLFLLSSFPSFLFFLSAFGGGDRPHRPPLRSATE